MAEAIKCVLLKQTKKFMQAMHFFSLSCGKVVTCIDFQSWICIHGYVVIDWKHVPILLTLEKVVDGGTTDNLTLVIMRATKTFGGFTTKEMWERLITFNIDGVSIFQGAKTSPLYATLNEPCCLNLIKFRCGERRGGVVDISLHQLQCISEAYNWVQETCNFILDEGELMKYCKMWKSGGSPCEDQPS